MKKILSAIITIILSINAVGVATAAENAKPEHELKQKVFVHWPKTKEGKRPPTTPACQVTGSDQQNDYLWAGWKMPSSGMSYKINVFTAPKNLKTKVSGVIQVSFQTWTNTDPKQIFNYGGTTDIRAPKYDGQNVIAWKGIESGAIAITYIWYWGDTGELAETDTMFNRNLPWSINAPTLGDCGGNQNSYDVQNIATHEFGHWVGLDDLYASVDSELTMYGYGVVGELKKDTLGAGDITGVLAIAP
ncbi:hypothetical protein A2Z23_02980 [Candidatus Curtissbacteria bacterium RBG_16_39_7]|uniref:Peptidase M10 metallopeptidase domain-containing protein n=1 Tax=Candidatus Curtissbacteria bacterium RBG_16_39_7 TaxID=1797707 RepID=A0A1F5G230_9BACT|nr:MAG: hypothetical protein A2Z23_02980 [Candidatus Curtissbacteria bacterium RBG_16_39_7]